MGKSFFPKALLYKEWLQKRWVSLGVFLLICPSVYLETLMPLTDPDHRFVTVTGGSTGLSVQQSDVVVNNFNYFCNAVLGNYTTGLWASIVVVGLALYSLWTERNNELWLFTLSGPVTKRQVLRAKYSFDLALIVAIFTLLASSLAIIDAVLDIGYPLYGVIRWWIAELAIQCSMYGLALFLGTLIGNAIAVALLTFGISNLPMYLGVLLRNVLGANWVVFLEPSQHTKLLSWKLMWLITHLSPLNWLSIDFTRSWTSPWPYFMWFFIFTVLACIVAETIYERTANERLSHFFAFEWLRHPLTMLLSALVACIVVKFTVDPVNWTLRVTWVVVVTMVIWVAATVVRGRIVKRF